MKFRNGVIFLCIAVIMLSGCRLHVNINKQTYNVEEMLEKRLLDVDPTDYSEEDSYKITVRYDKGGFEKMDLSQAYIAYYPFTVLDQINIITGGETEDIPPLPDDAQESLDAALGTGELEKIAVITVATLDDQTLTVSFTDRDCPIKDREYYFIIPNEGLAGSVIPG